MRPRDARWALTARFVDDEDAWLARLARAPQAVRPEIFRALEVAAAMDGVVSPAERTLLGRAAAALGVAVSPEALDRVASEFRDGAPESPLAAGSADAPE